MPLMSSLHHCPRCPDRVLASQVGAWLEDVCGSCNGRFLNGDTTLRLFEEHLRIGRAMLGELTLDGPRRLACPGCGQKMTLTMARGIQVDLCGGCGGAWLDVGELAALSRGQVKEVAADVVVTGVSTDDSNPLWTAAAAAFGAPTALSLARSRAREGPAARFAVYCTSCDAELDLHQVNWLINQYPWCSDCAAPYVGMGSMLMEVLGTVLGFLGGRSRRSWRELGFRRRGLFGGLGSGGESMVSHTVDSLRIAPEDAEQRFASFFRRVR